MDKAGNIAMYRIIDGRKVEVFIENADAEENEDCGRSWHGIPKRWKNSASQCLTLRY